MPYATIQRDYGQELIDALFGENATPEDMIYTVMASRLIWDNIHETATLIANEIDPTDSIPDLADNLAIGMVNSPDYLGVLYGKYLYILRMYFFPKPKNCIESKVCEFV